jgi:transcriptional regulator with XRE-family HTH domain
VFAVPRPRPGRAFPLFGERLREARVRAGLSPEECARRCGVRASTWLRWEQGTAVPFSKAELRAVADAVGTDPGWLLGVADARAAWPPRRG